MEDSRLLVRGTRTEYLQEDVMQILILSKLINPF